MQLRKDVMNGYWKKMMALQYGYALMCLERDYLTSNICHFN